MVRASSVHRATILRGPPGHTGNLQLDISDCASTLGGRVYYNLINVTTNDSVREGSSCWSQMVSSLPAGSYRLVISNGGHTGTYELDASLQP